MVNFNPRAPCGARPEDFRVHDLILHISIHAPRVGRDYGVPNYSLLADEFQSTRPVWGATLVTSSTNDSQIFQSTRPVWGATRAKLSNTQRDRNFNPRAPCGARLNTPKNADCHSKFQSTRPVWGATAFVTESDAQQVISIHAPRVGRDAHLIFINIRLTIISIHAPRVGRDAMLCVGILEARISIHAPRVGRDTPTMLNVGFLFDFNPRAPCGARR